MSCVGCRRRRSTTGAPTGQSLGGSAGYFLFLHNKHCRTHCRVRAPCARSIAQATLDASRMRESFSYSRITERGFWRYMTTENYENERELCENFSPDQNSPRMRLTSSVCLGIPSGQKFVQTRVQMIPGVPWIPGTRCATIWRTTKAWVGADSLYNNVLAMPVNGRPCRPPHVGGIPPRLHRTICASVKVPGRALERHIRHPGRRFELPAPSQRVEGGFASLWKRMQTIEVLVKRNGKNLFTKLEISLTFS